MLKYLPIKKDNIPVCTLPIKAVLVVPPFAKKKRSSFILGIELLSSSSTFGLTLYYASHTRFYTMLHILASTSLLLNMAVGYQSVSSLYSKRSLWN